MEELQPRSPRRRTGLILLLMCLAALVVYSLRLACDAPPQNAGELEKLSSRVQDLQKQVERLEGSTQQLQQLTENLLIAEKLRPQINKLQIIDQALDRKVTIFFPRNTLEWALKKLSQQIEIAILISDDDLKSEGITKQQSFGLSVREEAARYVLAKILKLANPDGKLVCVAHRAVDGSESIEVTTTAAAAKRTAVRLELPKDGPPMPRTVDEALKKKITVIFPRNTLEMTVQLISDEIAVPIVIWSNDLQLEGITKNQSFGLDERDQPARAVLRRILKLADRGGKLVCAVRRAADGEEQIALTTKSAAARRGEEPLRLSDDP